MKRTPIIVFGLLLFAGVALAETRYISEQLEVTLRTGPGNDRKIIAMLKSGQSLELLEPGEKCRHLCGALWHSSGETL